MAIGRTRRWRTLIGALAIAGVGLMPTLAAAQRGGHGGGMGLGGGSGGGGMGMGGGSGGGGMGLGRGSGGGGRMGTGGGGGGLSGGSGQGGRVGRGAGPVSPGLSGQRQGSSSGDGTSIGSLSVGGRFGRAEGIPEMTIFPRNPLARDSRNITILPPAGRERGQASDSASAAPARPSGAARGQAVGSLSPGSRAGGHVTIRPAGPTGTPRGGWGRKAKEEIGEPQENRLATSLFFAEQQVLRDFIIGSQAAPLPLPGRLAPNIAGNLGQVPVNGFPLDGFLGLTGSLDQVPVSAITLDGLLLGLTDSLDQEQESEIALDGLLGLMGGPSRETVNEFGKRRHTSDSSSRQGRNCDDCDDEIEEILQGQFLLPFLFSNPFFSGFGSPGSFTSASGLGWAPGWIGPSQGYYDTTASGYGDAYGHAGNGYDLDYRGVASALSDVREAWLRSDADGFATHLSSEAGVRVYFDGAYSYTSSVKDYDAMTRDAMKTARTTALDFDTPIWLAPDQVYVTARQRFVDPNGATHMVYVSYWLQLIDRGWYIVGVGSSANPLPQPYQDFRSTAGVASVPAY